MRACARQLTAVAHAVAHVVSCDVRCVCSVGMTKAKQSQLNKQKKAYEASRTWTNDQCVT